MFFPNSCDVPGLISSSSSRCFVAHLVWRLFVIRDSRGGNGRRSSMDFVDFCSICLIWVLGMVAVATGIAAEFVRTKEKEVRFYRGACTLPGSPAQGLGIAGAVAVLGAQLVTVCMAGCICCMRDLYYFPPTKRLLATILLPVSWVCFVIAEFLLVAGAVMNRRQRSWFNGQCYVVKSGVFAGAAALSAVAVTCDVVYYVAVAGCRRFVRLRFGAATPSGLPPPQPAVIASVAPDVVPGSRSSAANGKNDLESGFL